MNHFPFARAARRLARTGGLVLSLSLSCAGAQAADGPANSLSQIAGRWDGGGHRKEPVYGLEGMISVTRGPYLSSGYNLVEVERQGGLSLGADGTFALATTARVGSLGTCSKTTREEVRGHAVMSEPGRLTVTVSAGHEQVTYDPSCDSSPAARRDFTGGRLIYEVKFSDGLLTVRRAEPTGAFLFGGRFHRP